MKHVLLTAALIAALPMAALAESKPLTPEQKGLSAPVIMLTPVLAANADALGLDEAQKAAVKAFVAEMPAKRMALEDATVALRTELRGKIAQGAPVAERQALAQQIGENETKLVMMRSNCTDHWRGVLSAEQFAKLLELAKVTAK